jgi:hypothetical protein
MHYCRMSTSERLYHSAIFKFVIHFIRWKTMDQWTREDNYPTVIPETISYLSTSGQSIWQNIYPSLISYQFILEDNYPTIILLPCYMTKQWTSYYLSRILYNNAICQQINQISQYNKKTSHLSSPDQIIWQDN